MIIVLDVSAAAEIVLGRTKAEAFEGTLIEADSVLAPDLFVAEITNTFWKYHKIADMPLGACEEAINDALSLVDQLVPTAPLAVEVFSASCLTQHSAYDLFYIILARRFNARLLSLDTKLLQCARKLGVGTIPAQW